MIRYIYIVYIIYSKVHNDLGLGIFILRFAKTKTFGYMA